MAHRNNNNDLKKRVAVVEGGRDISHTTALELVTRKDSTSFDMEEKMADLWISQTSNIVTCRYWVSRRTGAPKAIFNDIKMTDMEEKLEEWEMENKGSLKKLASLIKQIIAAAKTVDKLCLVSFSGEKNCTFGD